MKVHFVDATLSGHVERIDLGLTRRNRIVVRRPIVRQPAGTPFPTAVGSALLVPAPWTHDIHPFSFLVSTIHTALALAEPVVFLVGHTRPDESAELGKARADAARCILEADSKAWVDLATRHGSIVDVKAYLQYLNAMLGWECYVENVDDTIDEPTNRAVEAFQRQYDTERHREILEDGVCGTETLGAIFDMMRFEWDRWLYKHHLDAATVQALDVRYFDASGADPVLPGMSALDGAHGLDALVVEKVVVDKGEPTATMLYGSAIARYEEYPVPIEPWAWERGPYTIVTDLFSGETIAQERYTLRSTDGEFETSLVLPDDAVDNGILELRFFAVPCDKSYDLSVQINREEVYPLFSDVPYNQLHLLAVEPGSEDVR